MDQEPIRVLLVKPYQPVTLPIASPPLGILYLAATLRQVLGAGVEVRVIDAWLDQRRYWQVLREVEEFRPHVLGISALNFEAEEGGRIAEATRRSLPGTVIALGGPFAHGAPNRSRIMDTGLYDWIFDGEADWSFPLAVKRRFGSGESLRSIVGLTWRNGEGSYVVNSEQALDQPLDGEVGDLDEIPFPAWDLVEFDSYARRINNNGNLRGSRYAPIFTSRGCPFLCTYCHDIFGKKFRWRSPENVLAEVELLRSRFGIDELQIVDDIFNMNSRRMKEICRGLAPMGMHICFPNGLRGDILDEEGCDALVDAGMYEVAVAIETVTPRLQDMVRKRLRLDMLLRAVERLTKRGTMVKGFFMLGFPTETLEEMQATVDFAVRSKLTHAVFNLVTPQPGTPLYDEACKESAAALERIAIHDYYAATCWYAEAYGVDLHKVRSRAYFRFYLSNPGRLARLARHMSTKDLVRGFYYWARKVFVRSNVDQQQELLPEALQPLRKLYSNADEGAKRDMLAPAAADSPPRVLIPLGQSGLKAMAHSR